MNDLSSKATLSNPFLLEIDEKIIVHDKLKRGFDILFSLIALVLSLPLFAILYILIKLTSPGPVFYCSLRIGRKGRLFKFWKLRSMYSNADERLEALLNSDASLKKEWLQYFKLKKDPRLTPLGKFLRSTSLDELPQFWNVLIGDLSIVGPRPYLPREIDRIHELLGKKVEKLFSVRPGLTGIWQTSGRNQLTFNQRVKLEMSYADKRCFSLDLQLIVKTIPILVFRKGAF